MLNEGIKLETGFGDALRVGFEYAGVSRRSDRHQIEAWTTAIVRCSRELTDRELQPVGVQIMHQRIPESAKIDAYFGCTAEFGADRDQVSFASEAAKLQIINADRYLNQACDRILRKCSLAPQGVVEPHSSRRRKRHHGAVAERPGAHRKRCAKTQPQPANVAA